MMQQLLLHLLLFSTFLCNIHGSEIENSKSISRPRYVEIGIPQHPASDAALLRANRLPSNNLATETNPKSNLRSSKTENVISYISSFRDLQESVFWPLHSSQFVTVPFGPTARFGFNRGIDIQGRPHEKVIAIYKGQVERIIYEEHTYNVILEHSFSEWTSVIDGHYSTKTWYTVYSGLRSVYVKPGEAVSATQPVGELTNSGVLYLELRVGTMCALDDYLLNLCFASLGYDPHINPMILMNKQHQKVQMSVSSRDKIQVMTESSNINRFLIEIFKPEYEEPIKTYMIDLNLRVGFDVSALDTIDFTKPYVMTTKSINDLYVMELTVPSYWINISDSWWAKVTVEDIWGTSSDISFSFDGYDVVTLS